MKDLAPKAPSVAFEVAILFRSWGQSLILQHRRQHILHGWEHEQLQQHARLNEQQLSILVWSHYALRHGRPMRTCEPLLFLSCQEPRPGPLRWLDAGGHLLDNNPQTGAEHARRNPPPRAPVIYVLYRQLFSSYFILKFQQSQSLLYQLICFILNWQGTDYKYAKSSWQ